MKLLVLIWNAYLEKLFNWIPANIQALYWFRRKDLGDMIFSSLCKLSPDVYRLSNFLKNNDFQWKQDPIWGILDFHQKAWVTCARKGGDCDDYAKLWKQILAKHGKIEEVVTVSKSLSAHKMVIFTRDSKCFLLSNASVVREIPEQYKQFLLNEFFGHKTWFTIIY